MFAVDSDSEHFGKVSYTLNGDDSGFFDIQDDGTVVLIKELDYEKVRESPMFSHVSIVFVEIFSSCQYPSFGWG